SGHSKWSTIKRKKGVADAKRSNVFAKVSKIITLAARDGGGDPNANFKLKLAVDKAKSVNMPHDNIDRAIKKGTGELEGAAQIEDVTYEAYGPGGVAIIIESITDNKNRTVSEIKKILSDNEGKLGGGGSVSWMFERKGVIRISTYSADKKEEIELLAIENDASDIKEEDSSLVIYVIPEKLSNLKEILEKEGIKIESSEVELIVKNSVKVNDQSILKKVEKLMEELDEHDDVNEIYSNIED
ncbi:MAG: YebC/PmpR family DNA-binding transcriptional regulator, partial [Parcubacteria group bacterium]|nr:YebC/PmpR family DNA-binding transcriptional regulator [Parcubacteria group bacterium]